MKTDEETRQLPEVDETGQPTGSNASAPGNGFRAAPEADVLTVAELAALLRVERKTAYAAIQRGEIPGVRRVGRSIRACRRTVLEWLAEGRVSRSRRTR